jgi:hypothetical protein
MNKNNKRSGSARDTTSSPPPVAKAQKKQNDKGRYNTTTPAKAAKAKVKAKAKKQIEVVAHAKDFIMSLPAALDSPVNIIPQTVPYDTLQLANKHGKHINILVNTVGGGREENGPENGPGEAVVVLAGYTGCVNLTLHNTDSRALVGQPLAKHTASSLTGAMWWDEERPHGHMGARLAFRSADPAVRKPVVYETHSNGFACKQKALDTFKRDIEAFGDGHSVCTPDADEGAADEEGTADDAIFTGVSRVKGKDAAAHAKSKGKGKGKVLANQLRAARTARMTGQFVLDIYGDTYESAVGAACLQLAAKPPPQHDQSLANLGHHIDLPESMSLKKKCTAHIENVLPLINMISETEGTVGAIATLVKGLPAAERESVLVAVINLTLPDTSPLSLEPC